MSSYEGFLKVRNGHFAFHCEDKSAHVLMAKMFDPHQICDTKTVMFRPSFKNGVILKKKSPFRERLSINWFRLREIGILGKHKKIWITPKPTCISSYYYKSIEFKYIAPLIVLLLSINILSFIILLCEIAFTRTHRNLISRQQRIGKKTCIYCMASKLIDHKCK